MWGKQLISKAPTIGYWMTVSDYLLSTVTSYVVSEWVIWPLTLNACDIMMCPWFFAFGHNLCPLAASILKRHDTTSRDPPISPWGFHGRNVCCATWWQVLTESDWITWARSTASSFWRRILEQRSSMVSKRSLSSQKQSMSLNSCLSDKGTIQSAAEQKRT